MANSEWISSQDGCCSVFAFICVCEIIKYVCALMLYVSSLCLVKGVCVCEWSVCESWGRWWRAECSLGSWEAFLQRQTERLSFHFTVSSIAAAYIEEITTYQPGALPPPHFLLHTQWFHCGGLQQYTVYSDLLMSQAAIDIFIRYQSSASQRCPPLTWWCGRISLNNLKNLQYKLPHL